jgi:hypothetical protein
MDPLDDAQHWEEACWYVSLDCDNCLDVRKIPHRYRDVLSNSQEAQDRRRPLRERFLLPVYFRESEKFHGHRRPSHWACHEDWERRVTLIGEPSPEGLRHHWQKTMARFQSLYLKTSDSRLRCTFCWACVPATNETTPDFRETWAWHQDDCLFFPLHSLLHDEEQEQHDQVNNAILTAYLSDPATPSDHLEMSIEASLFCRRVIAGNPNIPWKAVFALSRIDEIIDILATNPALPFLLHEPWRAEHLPSALRDRLFIPSLYSEK